MNGEYKVLFVGFQAEGTGGAKVRVGVAKGKAKKIRKGRLEHRGSGIPSCGDLLSFILYKHFNFETVKEKKIGLFSSFDC